jgi:hypothetical protein
MSSNSISCSETKQECAYSHLSIWQNNSPIFPEEEEQAQLDKIVNYTYSKITPWFGLLGSITNWGYAESENSKIFMFYEAMGHFNSSFHEKYFDKAVGKVKVFYKNVPYLQQLEKSFSISTKDKYWKYELFQEGTCAGNVVALANSIFKFNKLLTVGEMQIVTSTEAFIVDTQAIQLLYLQIGSVEAEEKHKLTNADQSFPIFDFNATPSNETVEIFEDALANSNILPSSFSKRLDFYHALSENFIDDLEKEICESNFSGVIFISSELSNGNAHITLLQVDQNRNRYILSDSNSGFFACETLENCMITLDRIRKILYTTFRIHFTFFPVLTPHQNQPNKQGTSLKLTASKVYCL